jgi:hypothetical protein
MRNHIAVVLDASASMGTFKAATIKAFNGIVEETRKNARKYGQKTSVSLYTFANTARPVFFNANVETLEPLDGRQYITNGMTALFDGVNMAIDQLASLPDADDEDTSLLVIALTDGEDNVSHTKPFSLKQKIIQKARTDRWTVVFQGPPGSKNVLVNQFGIPSDNVREWEATESGMAETQVVTSGGIGNYYAARSVGAKKVDTFFVQTDLSKVDAKVLVNNLTDISNRFKQYEVTKEEAVREFVEAKTKRPYVIGSSYYLLMKKEKVQKNKGVLIQEKGKKAVWGGEEARRLIGLPDGADAKVEPLNHSNYDVYVQSTSVNRILPRGTKVLVDVTRNVSAAPTWDHTAVAKQP